MSVGLLIPLAIIILKDILFFFFINYVLIP